ncbi:hypothetical protein [Deinococcus sonorensis]|uniref:Uncharacterized protein n=2 Tax=Deinococcus sonorensis TaxID=309891 RepID=A0AAU7UC80_9DEIO
MRAYRGIVENGVVVLVDARLPEGTIVTVTVGEAELLRARIASALKRPGRVKVRLKPTLVASRLPEPGQPEPTG